MTATAPDKESYRLALHRLALPRFAKPESTRPWVVALEGANGAGKSTLCRALSMRLGVPHCLGTDAAWFSDAFKVRMIRDADWYASAMFFLSGCFEQMRVLGSRTDRLIIMDRSIWSTFAVHAAASEERLAALIAMLQPVADQVRVPDLTIVLEASFATCQSRIGSKTGTARALDDLTASAGFHAREAEFYRWLSTQTPNVVFLDVDCCQPEAVAEKAATLVRPTNQC